MSAADMWFELTELEQAGMPAPPPFPTTDAEVNRITRVVAKRLGLGPDPTLLAEVVRIVLEEA